MVNKTPLGLAGSAGGIVVALGAGLTEKTGSVQREPIVR
jgi:hypothetical protein